MLELWLQQQETMSYRDVWEDPEREEFSDTCMLKAQGIVLVSSGREVYIPWTQEDNEQSVLL